MTNRRSFIKHAALAPLAWSVRDFPSGDAIVRDPANIRIGLVTYQWAKDWDLPDIIRNCTKSQVLGVELRVEHKHGVDTHFTSRQREEVKRQFKDSAVTLVGFGSNVHFDSPDPELLRLNIMRAKTLLALDHDIGGSGVKVKPNGFHKGIAHEKTIEQIGKALNEIGKLAGDLGQQLRLEVHGNETQELPNIRAILDVADNPNVAICWNCNPTDLDGKGFEYNFNLVKDRLGDTMHIHELDAGNYPYKKLMTGLIKMDYKGWLLLECSATDPADKVTAMATQRRTALEMLSALRKEG
ncbi:sugar phosphate isomerase/epimerase family protein [Compostibacter hankyongensis]|uniref:Xylose isomerase-like TIM barrel domain-containing protein n=1 Tax=Compostibacter hankyongensis TaxID=1007089 RepID=A0ABP8FWZ4_9BACT